jgi:hypothetical protein
VFGGMDAAGFGAAIEVAQVHGRLFGLRGPGKLQAKGPGNYLIHDSSSPFRVGNVKFFGRTI